MKNTFKLMAITMSLVMILSALTFTVSAAEDDTVIYYFVDCGDYTVDTVSEGDQFGIYNTVTDQFYGADPGSGYQWGIVDEALDTASSESYGDSRVHTTWTWAYEYNTANTDYPKEESNRYCHNMFESGIDRVITYKFEMPEAGDYVVEIGLSNPWNCASPVDLYLNGELAQDTIMPEANAYATAYANCTPDEEGFITVEVKTMLNTINLTFITISNKLTGEETTEFEYDTYVPVTDPETEETEDGAATTDPVDNSESDATTDAPEEESGCGSALSATSVLMTAVAASVALISKKRKK